MTRFQVLQGDCREVMQGLAPDSVDAIVTDPPYELGFMGKGWDKSGVAYCAGVWTQALRVLKPGGHLLAFGGSRTYHRLASAVEDAGFEVRDQIMWLYGSGFPKSLDVSKALDKEVGVEREVVRTARRTTGSAAYEKRPSRPAGLYASDEFNVTAPATDAARQWDGWGTALKPAHEPIVLARKPLAAGTVAANVVQFGTGALNVDGCRVPTSDKLGGGGEKAETSGKFSNEGWRRPWMDDPDASEAFAAKVRSNVQKAEVLGRWPANLLHDGSDEVEAAFAAFGQSKSQVGKPRGSASPDDGWGMTKTGAEYSDAGTASRFYYVAKASRADRDDGLSELPDHVTLTGAAGHKINPMTGLPVVDLPRKNPHPTVKPTTLMRYLCRLITPPGGTILDPFAGSGSTGRGAILEGFNFVGVELSEEYADIAERRIKAVQAIQLALAL